MGEQVVGKKKKCEQKKREKMKRMYKWKKKGKRVNK